jgi:hypothetical protein
MTAVLAAFRKARPSAAALVALSLVLAGCSSRDEAMAEKLARAEAAAKRAVAAQEAAEKIAAKLGAKLDAPIPVASESPVEEDDEELDNPDSDTFDNTIAEPQQAKAG